MLQFARIPELAQRDRFVRRAVKDGRVYTLEDEQNASVSSQKYTARTVQLFWSSALEGRRWAEALTGSGALQEISLPTFAADILPGLAAEKGLVGTDWVADPIESEVDPRDLLLRLKHEALPAELSLIRERGEVFLLASPEGPLLRPSELRNGGDVLAIFSSRASAERHKKAGADAAGGAAGAAGADCHIITDPLADFTGSTLPWATARGLAIACEPIPGAGFVELPAADLAKRL